jgi:hypothetical protein
MTKTHLNRTVCVTKSLVPQNVAAGRVAVGRRAVGRPATHEVLEDLLRVPGRGQAEQGLTQYYESLSAGIS